MENDKKYRETGNRLFHYNLGGEELQKLSEELHTKEGERDFLAEAKEQWAASKNSKTLYPGDKEELFRNILEKIEAPEQSNKQKEKAGSKSKKSVSFNGIIKVAAIFVLGMFLFWIGHRIFTPPPKALTYHTVTVPFGKQKTLLLPDGSKVWINAGSRVKYSDRSGKTRQVFLSGEAYFEIKKDSAHPFIVSTQNIKIKVLGTGFNVSAYPDENKITTTLVHGKIMAYCQNSKGIITRRVILHPGNQAVFSKKQKTFRVKKVHPADFTAWRNQVLLFQNTKLPEVIRRINRRYNVNIILNDKELEQFDYTVRFDHDSLNTVLTVLSKMTPVRFNRYGRNIYVTKKKKSAIK